MHRPLSAVLLILALGSTSAGAQSVRKEYGPPSSADTVALATFLRERIAGQRAENELLEDVPDSTTRYRAGYVPPVLKGEPSLILVYLLGRAWCAGDAAGCHTLIILRDAAGFRVIGDIHDTHLPLSALRTASRGLPDIAVGIAGGGPVTPHRARIRYDGASYPDDPWGAPSTREVGNVVVSATDRLHLLYPRAVRQDHRTR